MCIYKKNLHLHVYDCLYVCSSHTLYLLSFFIFYFFVFVCAASRYKLNTSMVFVSFYFGSTHTLASYPYFYPL